VGEGVCVCVCVCVCVGAIENHTWSSSSRRSVHWRIQKL